MIFDYPLNKSIKCKLTTLAVLSSNSVIDRLRLLAGRTGGGGGVM